MTKEQINWLKQRFGFYSYQELPVFGSKRTFYRLNAGHETRIAIIDDDPIQFNRFMESAGLFNKLDVKIPEIYDYSNDLFIILEEDLGDNSLEVIAHNKRDRIEYYKKVIDVLIGWQKKVDSDYRILTEYNLVKYDFNFARNETVLFENRYLINYLGIDQGRTRSLHSLFDDLAEKASNLPMTLIHRDFQARNIHWHKNQPFFIDFQAALNGPYTYDLAALIYDNHVDLRSDEKLSLLDYFYANYHGCNREDFYVAALQRTFQAISAYAFLSKELGKLQYIQYIPKGLDHLKDLSTHFNWIEKVFELIE